MVAEGDRVCFLKSHPKSGVLCGTFWKMGGRLPSAGLQLGSQQLAPAKEQSPPWFVPVPTWYAGLERDGSGAAVEGSTAVDWAGRRWRKDPEGVGIKDL